MIILVTILMLMCVTVSGTKDGSEMNCIPVIKVSRNTVFLAPVMSVLKINCTINLHGCHRKPRVSWCKMYGNGCNAFNYSDHIRHEWKNITEHNGIAFLIFLNISMEDAGLYRCKEGDTSVSHTINVTVTGDLNTFPNTFPKDQWLWYFVYIFSGTVGLVVIIISFLYVIRCQRRKPTSKDKANKNQYMETENNDLLLPPHFYLNSDVLTSVVYRV